MNHSFEIPKDPVELSRSRAESAGSSMFDHTPQDRAMLAELDYAADELNFINQSYLIETGLAFIIPTKWDRHSSVSYQRIDGLTLEGDFGCFSRVSIGRLYSSPHTVRSLCLTLRRAILLPYFDQIPDDNLMYIPVLAVRTISSYSSNKNES